MADRELVTREELRDRLDEELAKCPECGGARVGYLPLPLQEADSTGCNWDQVITVAIDSNMGVSFPDECRLAVARAISRVAERYNLA